MGPLGMPSKSPSQARLFAAVAHNPEFARKVGIPQSVGKEFNAADAGTGILSKRAIGGEIPQTPWFIRREAAQIYHPSGFLHDTGGGRSDTLPRTVAAESHVIPADVVAGLGEGNSLAGAKVLDMMMHSGPFGMTTMRHRAAGGAVPQEKVPVALSGGEYTLSPEQVATWGGGSLRKGHSAIDKFILGVRKHTANKLRTLPPPRR